MMRYEMRAAIALLGAFMSPILVQAYDEQPLFGDAPVQPPQYLPGEKVRDGQMLGVYDASASYVCKTSWDAYVTANYIYWSWNVGTLQFGTLVADAIDQNTDFNTQNSALYNTPGYTSGYQLGMGIRMKGMDNWSSYSKYTWYKSTNYVNFTGTPSRPFIFTSNNFLDRDSFFQGRLSGEVTDKAQLGFQAADSVLKRAFYLGKKLIGNFYFGLRGQWISQYNSWSSAGLTFDDIDLTYSNLLAKADQTSWSVGPKAGFDASWLLGYGIKITGSVAQSLLYTSFNTADSLVLTRPNGTVSSTYNQGLHNYGTISPVTESCLGLGWGTYLCDDNFHLDLSIGYDFDVYWNYNMVFASNTQRESNLYIYGMNIGLRLDF